MATQTEQDKDNVTLQRKGRRRFIRQVGIATPVVMSLSSRFALGAQVQCLSAQLSGNLSHAHPAVCESATGRDPAFWEANNTIWPSPYSYGAFVGNGLDPNDWTSGTLFNDASAFPTALNSDRMGFIVKNQATTVEAHAIAALLNATQIGASSVVTVQQVRDTYFSSLSDTQKLSIFAFTWA